MKLITALVLSYNEERFIEPCLRSIVAFQKPEGFELEILVVDGGSTDKTREIVAKLTAEDARIRLVDNPGRITPCGMNVGVRAAAGDYIAIFSSHAHYPEEYLVLCVETAERTKADNVGGIAVTLPGGEGYEAQLVQALTTHKFGVGNSGFRTNMPEGLADTVMYGFYRREVFQRIGYFDERLVRAQDYELNRRLKASGGTIWFNPKIRVNYHNMASLSGFYRKQIKMEAPYNAYMWSLAPYSFAVRHGITAAFALGVIGGVALAPQSILIALPFVLVMALYALLAIASALQQAVRFKSIRHAFFLPSCFFLYHFLHGIGVWIGLFKLALGRAPVQKLKEPWPGAGRSRAWPVA